jgi:hypothetical protein
VLELGSDPGELVEPAGEPLVVPVTEDGEPEPEATTNAPPD